MVYRKLGKEKQRSKQNTNRHAMAKPEFAVTGYMTRPYSEGHVYPVTACHLSLPGANSGEVLVARRTIIGVEILSSPLACSGMSNGMVFVWKTLLASLDFTTAIFPFTYLQSH
jgi:hypothetical protein